MKELGKYFQQRRYSSVEADDETAMMQQAAGLPPTAAVALQRHCAAIAEKQRRKSLKANRSMNPAGILSSFFNERHNSKGARSPKCAFVLLAIGVLAITIAILVKVIHPYDLIFRWKLVLADNGEIFNLWAEPPVDLYIKIYLFNITNAAAFLAGQEKMNVQQVGPYVYKEIMTHKNISFNDNNTISTTPSHPLVWQEHLSEGNREDDEVVMLNIAMLAISHLAADKTYFFRMALNTLFITSKSLPIVRMTAKQFMFGYPSSLTTLGNTFLPNWISFEKVGLIDRMYDFDSDFETFHTGVPDPSIAGLYATYRGSPNLPQWNGEQCSNIELASDGTKFNSFIQPNDSVKFFRKSMCRPMQLHREGEAETYGSLTGYKYVFEENAFDNGVYNKNNSCFCRKGLCQPRGLIDVTDCYYGFPISLSYPHFVEGDPGLQKNITGLKPDKENFSSAFVIQPESGLPLSLSVKVQINMHFNDMSTIRKVSRFSHLTAPMLWFEIMMPKLPENLDRRFNFYINILPYLDVIGFWGGWILGVALLVYAVTRATLRMSSFSKAGTISEGILYSKANLLRTTAAGNVYNPCEMTLITSNEKANQQQQQQHVITRNADEQAKKTSDMLYSQIDVQHRSQSAFALEMEPTTSDSTDEGNDSDTATMSRNSSTSSCMDEHVGDNFLTCKSCQRSKDSNETSNSFGSSGLASSITDSHDIEINMESDSQTQAKTRRWSLDESNTALYTTPQNNKTTASRTAAPKSSHQIHEV